MPYPYRVAARAPGLAKVGRPGLCCIVMVVGALAQGCSASRETGESSPFWKLWGDDKPAASARLPEREPWQQPAAFDADAPTGPVYRGGRDPVTGRAQAWPPAAAAPTPVAAAPLAPLPPAAPNRYESPSSPSPYARPAPAAPATAAGAVEVRTGDTLYRIATTHNVTVPSLMQANGLSSENIRVGQRIVIPGR